MSQLLILLRSWLTSTPVRVLVRLALITVSAYFGVMFLFVSHILVGEGSSDDSMRVLASAAGPLLLLWLLAVAYLAYGFFWLAHEFEELWE